MKKKYWWFETEWHSKMDKCMQVNGICSVLPMPEATYFLLKRYWLTHRNKRLIFLAVGRDGQGAPTDKAPMSIDGVQGAFRKAGKRGTRLRSFPRE